MNPIISLNISIGIFFILATVMVYCVYETRNLLRKIIQSIKDYKKAQKQLEDFINNTKSYSEDLGRD